MVCKVNWIILITNIRIRNKKMKHGDSITADFGDQPTMFAKEHFYRPSDPPTSKTVAMAPIRGECAQVLRAVDQMITSFTAHELADNQGLDKVGRELFYIKAQKRLSVLQRGGYVAKSDSSDPNFVQRNGAAVWRRTMKAVVYYD